MTKNNVPGMHCVYPNVWYAERRINPVSAERAVLLRPDGLGTAGAASRQPVVPSGVILNGIVRVMNALCFPVIIKHA